jgi:hypothetical protein
MPSARSRHPIRLCDIQPGADCGQPTGDLAGSLRRLTSNLRWADSPGNVLLAARSTGLPRSSVANVSQIVTLDDADMVERVGNLSRAKLELLLAGVDTALGR